MPVICKVKGQFKHLLNKEGKNNTQILNDRLLFSELVIIFEQPSIIINF